MTKYRFTVAYWKPNVFGKSPVIRKFRTLKAAMRFERSKIDAGYDAKVMDQTVINTEIKP